MTARQKRIWDLLAEHDCLTSQQIAALLHISDRTVRSDIKEINGEHASEVIRSKKGQGYFIDAGQPEKNVPASKPNVRKTIWNGPLSGRFYSAVKRPIWNWQKNCSSAIHCFLKSCPS